MEKFEKEFLSVLSAFFQNRDDVFVSAENLEKIFSLANDHNLLPLVCDVLSKKYGEEKAFQKAKPLALAAYSSQCLRNERFLCLYRTLAENGIEPICVKGACIRSLYKNGSLRPSGDEDLLIKKEDEERFERIMHENSFVLRSMGENEKAYFDSSTSLLIEAHTSLFFETGELGKKLNGFFSSPFSDAKKVQVETTPVLTLGIQSGLLYLVCHAFKHFIRCGFGIRQVCDIAVYMREYKESLDFALLESELSKINAKVFFEGMVNIAVKHLGFSDIAFPLLDTGMDEMPLLEDILRAGVYGKSNSSRVHSAGITLCAVTEEKDKASVFSALFPSAKSLAKSYPSLNKLRFLYPWFAFLRIAKYIFSVVFKKGNAGTPKESLRIAKERTKLLKKYKIMPETSGIVEGKSGFERNNG